MDDYSAGETIGFSAQLAAIYTELSRYSSLFCRARFGLSVTEYELLLCLWEAETPHAENEHTLAYDPPVDRPVSSRGGKQR